MNTTGAPALEVADTVIDGGHVMAGGSAIGVGVGVGEGAGAAVAAVG